MNTTDIEKTFETAIGREIEAHEFYSKVANKVSNETVKEVFTQLAAEELQHKELLKKLKSDSGTMAKFAAPDDYKVSESVESLELSIDMLPKDAIALAMKKEQEAMEFYKKLASETNDDELKDMLENLSNMELQHKHRLENVFTDIGYPEAF